MRCPCLCRDKPKNDALLTVLKREFGSTHVAFDIMQFLHTRCFVVYSEIDGHYSYLRNESGNFVWDDSVAKTPVELTKMMKVAVTDGAVSASGDMGRYLFDISDLTENRDYVKHTTREGHVSLLCAVPAADVPHLIREDKRWEFFACNSVELSEVECTLRTIGLFAAARDPSGIKGSQGALTYVPVVRTLEHDHDKGRSRIVINGKKEVLVYDADSDTWLLGSLDENNPEEDVQQYIEHRVWTGASDEHTVEIAEPVVVCGLSGAAFTSASTLPNDKKSELQKISEGNVISLVPPMMRHPGSLFKHAASLSLETLSMDGKSTVSVYEFEPVDLAQESHITASMLTADL